jgi:hypothetical protein
MAIPVLYLYPMLVRPKISYHPYLLVAFYLKCLPADLLQRIPDLPGMNGPIKIRLLYMAMIGTWKTNSCLVLYRKWRPVNNCYVSTEPCFGLLL